MTDAGTISPGESSRPKRQQSSEFKRVKAQFASEAWRLNNLYWVQDENGAKVPFVQREPQRWYFENRWFLDIITKARQLGFSSEIAIEMLDMCLFHSNTSAGIIDITLDDAKKKLAKARFAYENLPLSLQTKVGLLKDNEEELYFSNGSRIEVGTSHRGGTLQFLHVCLDGETGIYTAGGIVKPISEIVAGDRVLTSRGSYREVRALIKNRQSDLGIGLLEISAFGWYAPLRITENHMILTRQKGSGAHIWKPAGELRRGDYLALPIREPGKNLRDGRVSFGDRRIVPDENLAWLCGMYLAEGTIRSRGGRPPTDVVFALDVSEVPAIVEALQRLNLRDETKAGGKLIHVADKNGRTRTVTVNSKEFAAFIAGHFGSGDGKHIPDKVWKWGAPFLHALVRGYFDGDGSYKDENCVSAVSTRRQIIDQLRLICVSLRYGVPSIYFSPAGLRHGRNCKDSWTIRLTGAANWKFREWHNLPLPEVTSKSRLWRISQGRRPEGRKYWRRGADVYWMRVTGVAEAQPIEYVYDIALDEVPHNYVTVNGVVHNSEYGKIAAEKPDVAMEIKTGAFQTVAAGNRIVVESTAHGTAGLFWDMVDATQKHAQAGLPLSQLDWRLHFFAWWRNKAYRLPSNLVIVTAELRQYFQTLRVKHGVRLDALQEAWYARKYYDLGPDKMKEEYPSTVEELFFASVEGAFFKREMAKARADGRIGHAVPYDPTRGVYTMLDIGVDGGMFVIFAQTDGVRHRVIDCLEDEDHTGSVQLYASWLREKERDRGFRYTKHYAPHDMMERSWASEAKTRKDIAAELGITVEVVPKVAEKADSIEMARRRIASTWFDEVHARRVVECLDNYQKKWNKATQQWSGEPLKNGFDHGADAYQNGACGYAPDAEIAPPRSGRARSRPKGASAWSA